MLISCALAGLTACSASGHAQPAGASTSGGARAAGSGGTAGHSFGGQARAGSEPIGGGGESAHTGSGGSTTIAEGGSAADDAGAPSTDGGAKNEGGSENVGGLGAGAASGQGGAVGAGGGAIDAPIGACAALRGATTEHRLDLSTAAADRFGGITPDEQVIAWTTSVDDQVQLLSAERTDLQQGFGPVQIQSIPAASDRVTLSPDGLRVVYVNTDRRGFSTLSRETIEETWAASQSFEFSLLNEPGALPAHESYGDPVLSGTDLAFVYSRFGPGRTQTLFISHRFSKQAPWQVGQELKVAADFAAVEDDRFQPTGLTADELTLFLWHAAERQQYAVQFDTEGLTFGAYSKLGPLGGALANRDCTRLYYDSADDSSDLFMAESR